MGNSRDEIVTQICYQTSESKTELKNYMNINIKQNLKYISKSILNGFNCRYNTSSITESSNSRLKMLFPSHCFSLTDIRVALTSAEHFSLLLKQFIR